MTSANTLYLEINVPPFLNPETIGDLNKQISKKDEHTRFLVLKGSDAFFCAGLDLAVFGNLHSTSADPARRAEQFRRTALRMQDNLTAIEKCRVPVLAAIHRTCIGGGVDMTCCADMRYATKDGRDGALKSGMETGVERGYERLDDILAAMPEKGRRVRMRSQRAKVSGQ